jgi:hypothetical protein
MIRHRSAASRACQRMFLILGLIALAMAPLLPAQTVAQVASEAEVIAVEDITSTSHCVLTAEDYADKAQTQLIESRTSPCPAGSVLRAKRMPLTEAEAQRVSYVVATGNPTVDEAAVDELKLSLLTAIHDPASEVNGMARTSSGDCGTPTYRTRYLSYNASGGRITVGVRYYDVEDSYPDGCDVIEIYQSFSYVSDPLTADLWWDQEYYSGGISARNYDMGCKKFVEGSTNYTNMYWRGWSNYWFTDESIDENSPNCEWWGTEFTGAVILDA